MQLFSWYFVEDCNHTGVHSVSEAASGPTFPVSYWWVLPILKFMVRGDILSTKSCRENTNSLEIRLLGQVQHVSVVPKFQASPHRVPKDYPITI